MNSAPVGWARAGSKTTEVSSSAPTLTRHDPARSFTRGPLRSVFPAPLRGKATEPCNRIGDVLRRFPLREMPNAAQQDTTVWTAEETFLALGTVGMVTGIRIPVEYKGRHRQYRRRVQSGVIRSVERIAGRVSPPVTVRMQDDGGPIRVVESLGGLVVVLLRVPAGG